MNLSYINLTFLGGVTTTTAPPSSCGIPDDKGDGWCDDVNNNAGCNWDDGDCCPPNSIENPNWNGVCSKCKCLDPNAGGSTTTTKTTTTFWNDMCIPDKKCDDWPGGCGQAIGAGRCDVEVRKYKLLFE